MNTNLRPVSDYIIPKTIIALQKEIEKKRESTFKEMGGCSCGRSSSTTSCHCGSGWAVFGS